MIRKYGETSSAVATMTNLSNPEAQACVAECPAAKRAAKLST
tara:strand:+ start:737 stop:862 length:126 start_codon:yes stop_codon:yes gene_type:complete